MIYIEILKMNQAIFKMFFRSTHFLTHIFLSSLPIQNRHCSCWLMIDVHDASGKWFPSYTWFWLRWALLGIRDCGDAFSLHIYSARIFVQVQSEAGFRRQYSAPHTSTSLSPSHAINPTEKIIDTEFFKWSCKMFEQSVMAEFCTHSPHFNNISPTEVIVLWF